MPAHAHIGVLFRKHERKAYLHHDQQRMEIPYDNGSILFRRNPVSWGYAAESGNALTVQAACPLVNRIIIRHGKALGTMPGAGTGTRDGCRKAALTE